MHGKATAEKKPQHDVVVHSDGVNAVAIPVATGKDITCEVS